MMKCTRKQADPNLLRAVEARRVVEVYRRIGMVALVRGDIARADACAAVCARFRSVAEEGGL
jgi:hypothetical protein